MNRLFYIAVPLLVAQTIAAMLPTRLWFDPAFVSVADQVVGADFALTISLEKTTDDAVYRRVELHRKVSALEWHLDCATSYMLTPADPAAYPNPVTFSWWSHGECPAPQEGSYFVRTQWIVALHPIFGQRAVSIDSNPFNITKGTP